MFVIMRQSKRSVKIEGMYTDIVTFCLFALQIFFM